MSSVVIIKHTKQGDVEAAGFCSTTVAVCKGLALKGHRWEPATLISMSLASAHNYHI